MPQLVICSSCVGSVHSSRLIGLMLFFLGLFVSLTLISLRSDGLAVESGDKLDQSDIYPDGSFLVTGRKSSVYEGMG